ncbi:MAG TPA: ABC transporter substrate binding protein [Clostridiales bacterium]|nr:ABC transporter substrate binding protein [Clostridiales bacterium]HQD30229.1 ABC transporter substrate binding protein [Clostridiales bacterium]
MSSLRCNVSGRKMMFFLFISLLLFIVMTKSFVFAVRSEGTDSVLVLHSYDQGLAWTNRQNEGIVNIFGDSEASYRIYVEYMDWRNHPEDENLEQLREYLRYKYMNRNIAVVIATGDVALQFALDNRTELFSDAPVIFSGVNETTAREIIGDRADVTGVTEEIDPVGTVKAAFRINPDIRKIYVVYDNSANGIIQGEAAVDSIAGHAAEAEVIGLDSSDPVKVLDTVSKADDDSIVICTTLTAGNAADVSRIDHFCSALCRESRVPVYSLYDIGFGNGAAGGSMVSGRLQGEEAAKLALRVLGGEDISDIPFVKKNTTRYVFDYKVLQRFGINISLLPADSEIINKPGTYLEDNKGTVLAAVVIIVMLLMFITILLFYLKRLQAMKKELSESNIKLTGLYEDLSLASRKLKKQYDELTAVQQDLSTSEYKLELLFEKMMNGFFIFEPVFNTVGKIVDMRFLMVNPGFFQNIGMEKEVVVGKTWLEVFGSPNRDLARYQNLLDTGWAERFESYDPQKKQYYLVESFLIAKDQIGVIFENITDYKTALKEVRQLNIELEKRVADRTAKLREAVAELESFAYTVSHDMKSPMRAVDGYVQILLEDFGDKLDSDAVEMLNNIRTISRESIDMINMILQYSKTSAAVLNREPVDLEAMVTEVFNELKLGYPDRDIRLTIETGLPGVSVDRILFRQLLQNIISNSMKFTAIRDKALIAVGCTITQDSYVFYVRDNGVGFDMKYSGKLFGLFQRLHTPDEFDGSGIGLVTVKKIIEKHDGKVWIEGKVDEGATVYFTLPLEASAQ